MLEAVQESGASAALPVLSTPGERRVAFLGKAPQSGGPVSESSAGWAPEVQESVKDLLGSQGVDLRDFCPRTLWRRTRVRMERLGLSDVGCYLARLEADPVERGTLLDTVVVRVSSFFRDPLVWATLEERVVPGILAAKLGRPSTDLRVWSAGCGQGEEAYSLAILLHDSIERRPEPTRFTVFATDINPAALDAARRAEYPRQSFQDTRLGILERHFRAHGAGYRLESPARDAVHFSLHDLGSERSVAPAESVFGSFDLILCRNVLMYYGASSRRRMLDNLRRSLAPAGTLVVGDAEDCAEHRGLECVDRECRFYQSR
jgi:chemotaxis methyl-accepting protein methylase